MDYTGQKKQTDTDPDQTKRLLLVALWAVHGNNVWVPYVMCIDFFRTSLNNTPGIAVHKKRIDTDVVYSLHNQKVEESPIVCQKKNKITSHNCWSLCLSQPLFSLNLGRQQ